MKTNQGRISEFNAFDVPAKAGKKNEREGLSGAEYMRWMKLKHQTDDIDAEYGDEEGEEEGEDG